MSSSYDDLCEELIEEILVRLPTKSLLRIRTVSKSLCACISSPGFIRLHTLRSPEKLMLVHDVYNDQGRERPSEHNKIYTLHSRSQLSCDDSDTTCMSSMTSVEYPFQDFSVVGSCDGIVCLYKYNTGINLWNPSIRRIVTVRGRPSLSDHERHWDPLGFGFDPVVDDYKHLVRARCNTEENKFLVYPLKTDTWREIASRPVTPIDHRKSCQCLFNGVLYWTLQWYPPIGEEFRHYYYYILAFDLSSEVFSTIEVPEPSWETNQPTIINGILAVAISSKHDDVCKIWVRSNDTNTWSIAFQLNNNKHELGDFLLNHFPIGAVVHWPGTRRFAGLCGSCGVFIMIPCVESLQLLDIRTSCVSKRIIPFKLQTLLDFKVLIS
ncbi:F-box/kelch-repeat protein At3g06240-like [Bidens hawaiensis]|uniref:F-box/kelch-repeat protein At3g06240-like n=1 Tax=Bidens hawaiensis TaxID=980011 RepID=UPI0040493F30